MSSVAHIAVFLYKRPDRAAATLEALRKCDLAADSALTIHCDGPASTDEAGVVEEVRQVARNTPGFRQVDIVEPSDHQGRSRLVVDAVARLVARHDRVIVVEDNIVVSPWFLTFMNDGLETYAGEEDVVSICGYSYAIPAPETYFLPGAHCWGWATWQRAWSHYDGNASKLLARLRAEDRIYAFDAGGAEPLTQALHDTVVAGEPSWSLCWMASALLDEKLTLFPGLALVRNVDYCGDDADVAPVFGSELAGRPVDCTKIPVDANRELVGQLAANLMRWRCRANPRFRLYRRAVSWLPQRVERKIYSTIVGRRLQRIGRDAGSSGWSFSGVND